MFACRSIVCVLLIGGVEGLYRMMSSFWGVNLNLCKRVLAVLPFESAVDGGEVIVDGVCGMRRCIAEWSVTEEIVLVTLWCVRGGMSVQVVEGVSHWSVQEPLRGKVGRGGCRVVRWEARRNVRARRPVPSWVEDWKSPPIGYHALGRSRGA
jgi:hypothetical protein